MAHGNNMRDIKVARHLSCMSTQEQINALNIEINRSKNHISFLEERLTPQQRLAAQKLEAEINASRVSRSAKTSRK